MSVVKNESESRYTFEKKNEFIPFLEKLLIDLGFEKNVAGSFTHDSENEDQPEPLPYHALEEMEDLVPNIKNEDYLIDLFVGHKKVILILRYNKDKQQEISDKIFKFAEFKK